MGDGEGGGGGGGGGGGAEVCADEFQDTDKMDVHFEDAAWSGKT